MEKSESGEREESRSCHRAHDTFLTSSTSDLQSDHISTSYLSHVMGTVTVRLNLSCACHIRCEPL
jgi:hypothetical protein